ncbi:MAG: replication-relaxation family protein [Myxococcales bacterium]|nr:replication-relaxation family protein [Myxococcales bacterium]
MNLVERDYDMFAFLGEVGIARTHHLADMFFPSRTTAADRLRKLFCGGFIRCFARSLHEDNAYALARPGRDALDAVGRGTTSSEVVQKLPKQLEHRSMIVDMRVLFARACLGDARVALGEFVMDREFARLGLPKPVPDAKVALVRRATGASLDFLIECDRATESATWLVREKLARYAEAERLGLTVCGIRSPLVLIVTPSVRRAQSIADRMRTRMVSGSFAFAVATHLAPANVLGKSYAMPSDLLQGGAFDHALLM